MTAKRIARLVALAAATLVSATAMAQDAKPVSEAEKNYQAGGSPLAEVPMYQSMNPKAPKMTQAEFVASLSTKVSKPKVPQLEATEAQLARFPKAEPAAEPDAAPALPPATSYPPLESPRR